jgi:hypothetical protein
MESNTPGLNRVGRDELGFSSSPLLRFQRDLKFEKRYMLNRQHPRGARVCVEGRLCLGSNVHNLKFIFVCDIKT